MERRTASRKTMFDMVDLRQRPPRGWIGFEQFVTWATDPLITRVATIDIHADVDYCYHICFTNRDDGWNLNFIQGRRLRGYAQQCSSDHH